MIPTLSERAPGLLPAVAKTMDVRHEVDSKPAPFQNQPRKVRHPLSLQRFKGLPPAINLGDLVRTICVVFRNQLPQCGVRLFFQTNRVLRRAAYSALASL
jgi:hypothetical protein